MNDEFFELNRTISKVYATENGLFHSTGDETVDLPEELQGGALLEVDVVHAVQLTNAKGEILILHFDVPKAQNASENETSFDAKETVTVDGGDNQMQASKVDQTLIDKGNNMKSVLSIEDNIS